MINSNLENDKVYLMPIEESMLPFLKSYRNNYDVRRWCRQVGLLSDFNQKEWFNKINTDQSIKMFAIIEIGDDEYMKGHLVGVCGLTNIDFINSRAEFSCYIAKDFRLRGYCYSSLNILFGFGFGELNLNVIWGETFEDNPARKTFAKLGMKEEGTRRQFYYKEGKYINAVLVSITKKEFIKRLRNEN